MSKLAELRKKLKEQDEKRARVGKPSLKDGTYPFWNLKTEESAKVRFLADGNENNPFFWVDKAMLKFTFPGVLGGDQKEVTVQVPCVNMYGEKCPVLAEVSPWFNDPTMKELAHKYWAKRTHLYQGFVQESALDEEELPENPIRKFVISPQIQKIIRGSLYDFEEMPTDSLNGTDFIITKSKSGEHNGYTTSKWARRESSLTEEQLSAIEQYGLTDLSTWLPPNPSKEARSAIFEMFEASLNGELYDPARWGQFYKPYGLDIEANSSERTSSPKPATKPTQHRDDDDDGYDDIPVKTQQHAAKTPEKPVAPAASSSAADLINMIRNRNRVSE